MTVWKQLSKNRVPNNHFQKSIWKSNCPEAHFGTQDSYSNQINKYQLPHTWFNQISDHKQDLYWYGKLSAKLLAQAAIKNTDFVFTKTWCLLFSFRENNWLFQDSFRNDYLEKLKKYSSLGWKSNCPETR